MKTSSIFLMRVLPWAPLSRRFQPSNVVPVSEKRKLKLSTHPRYTGLSITESQGME